MTWPRDEAKLERVRALMRERGLEALVVRAPDNVLYLTNFWGMKGFDAVVFPAEGDPTLICLEPSRADAERTAWTEDLRLFGGYDERDPRPPSLRALELAVAASEQYETVGIELSLGTQAADRMVGEPTTFPKAWFDAFPHAQDATPLLNDARMLKTSQEIERMRLANEIAAAAMEHAQGVIAPGQTEAQIASEWLGFVHGEGTGWAGKVELALGFSLVWSGPGIRSFTSTTNRPVVEGEPTLFEIWVCADGYWCDHTKNLVPGELSGRYQELEAGLMGVYDDAVALLRPGRIAAGARPADPGRDRRDRLPGPAVAPGLPRRRRPRTRAAVRAPGGRRRDPRGDGACNRARMLLGRGRRIARRGQLPDRLERRREAEPVPRRGGAGVIDRSKIWTGSLNERALDPQPHTTIGLYDTTLRDGEQSVGVVLSPEDKLEIAKALDAAGIDRIEAGFPRVSADDWRAVELVSAAGLRAEVWGFSRAVQADVEALVELGVPASVIESPISDGKLEALGVSREKMLDRIRGAVSFAVGAGIKVAFFGVDSSRADPEFYRRAYETAVEAGAAEVVVVDTIGIATPEAAAYLVGQTVDWLGGEIPVHWHGHDDFGLGTAAAIAAVQAGATWVQGTINGMGERAGNADLVEVALALEALYGIPTHLDLTRARALSRLVQERSGTLLPSWKAVTGDALFTRESGAVAAQFHDPAAIEPYSSELVGAERGIVLGKKSGIDSIRITAARLGIELTDEQAASALAAVKERGAEKRGLVTDDEFRALLR